VKFDWTVNVPLLITAIGVVVALVKRFVRLELLLEVLQKWTEKHEEHDGERFDRLEGRLDRVTGK
jgi:hypothetical protein